MRVVLVALACAVAVAGCGDDDVQTQVIVRIDAQEGVKEAFRELKVEVEGLSEGAKESGPFKSPRLPYVLGLRPHDGNARREYRVTAIALNDDGEPYAQARLVSRFVEGERRYVVLELEDACISDRACEMVDETCHAAQGEDVGSCVDATIDPDGFSKNESDVVTVGDLIDQRPDAGVPDGGAAGDAMVGGGAGGGGVVAPGGGAGGRSGGSGGRGAAGSGGDSGAGAGTGGTPSTGCDSQPEDCPPLLSGLVVTAGGGELLLTPEFEPDEDEYEVLLPLAFDQVAIVARAAAPLDITIEGDVASSGATVVSSYRPAGPSELEVVVSNAARDSKAYTIAITRGRQVRYLKANDSTAGGLFGTAVAISGDRIAVARDPEDSGAVYAFEMSGAVWGRSDPRQLLVPDADGFGTAVAMAGSVTLVGAPRLGAIGAAYIYEGGSTTTLMGTQIGDFFGSSVAIGADTIAIGSASLKTLTIVQRSEGNPWTTIDPGTTPWAGSGAPRYGEAVAVSPDGNLVAVGAPGADADHGLVYVFQRSGMEWAALPTVAIEGGPPRFGRNVALANDMLVASAYDDDENDGVVYASRWGGTNWVSSPRPLELKVAASGTRFGSSLALAGDLLVVGASFDSSGARGVFPQREVQNPSSYSQAGAAYVFKRSGNMWSEQAYLKPNNPGPLEHFGAKVAISDGVIVVGAPNESTLALEVVDEGPDNKQAKDSGAAYVFQ